MSKVPSAAMAQTVTSESSALRPFLVVVSEPLIGNGESCLDLSDGDIFLTTHYNKVGYWWGVSVYDLNRQGWFPSTFVQPYTGEVPPEASELRETLQKNYANQVASIPQEAVLGSEASQPKPEFNIVPNDSGTYVEYDATTAVVRRGRRKHIGEGPDEDDEDQEDFPYEQWAESKAEAPNSVDIHKRSRA